MQYPERSQKRPRLPGGLLPSASPNDRDRHRNKEPFYDVILTRPPNVFFEEQASRVPLDVFETREKKRNFEEARFRGRVLPSASPDDRAGV
jgi:hypothetical protein